MLSKNYLKKSTYSKTAWRHYNEELTKDQEKNADFEARLSRLITGAGKKII